MTFKDIVRHIAQAFLEFDPEKGGGAVFEGQLIDFKFAFLTRFRSAFSNKDLETEFAKVVKAAIEETKEKICFEKFQCMLDWQCMFLEDIL